MTRLIHEVKGWSLDLSSSESCYICLTGKNGRARRFRYPLTAGKIPSADPWMACRPKEPSFPLPSSPAQGAASSYSHTLISLLERCSSMKELRAIHAHAVVLGLARFTYVASRILAFCALSPKGSLAHARDMFDRISQPTVFNWNTMIKGYSRGPRPKEGVAVYALMRRQGVDPNMHTFPFTVKACSHLSSLSLVHAQILKFGFDADVYVQSSLIKAYSDCGSIELAFEVFGHSANKNVVSWSSLVTGCCAHGLVDLARRVFDEMQEKNDISWSAMISGYNQNERYEEAVGLFRDLRACGCLQPNGSLLASALNACASLGASEEGRWIHSYLDREEMEYGVELGTALVDFYAKCGSVGNALEVFGKMKKKDVTAWSAMIMGLAVNGQAHMALDFFSKMLGCEVAPNVVTFISVLCACNHGGLVDEGWEIFKLMRKVYGISPTIEHYGCMVDLLARAGDVNGAVAVVTSMPMVPDGAIWGSLLSGCMMHGYEVLGEKVGKRLVEVDPEHGGRYISLANMYATGGRWEGVAEVRKIMKKRGVQMDFGCSSIEIGGSVHHFLVDDRKHRHLQEIYAVLLVLSKELDHLELELV